MDDYYVNGLSTPKFNFKSAKMYTFSVPWNCDLSKKIKYPLVHTNFHSGTTSTLMSSPGHLLSHPTKAASALIEHRGLWEELTSCALLSLTKAGRDGPRICDNALLLLWLGFPCSLCQVVFDACPFAAEMTHWSCWYSVLATSCGETK